MKDSTAGTEWRTVLVSETPGGALQTYIVAPISFSPPLTLLLESPQHLLHMWLLQNIHVYDASTSTTGSPPPTGGTR